MISALVLAAGQSRRMGMPKMLLPWGNSTIVGQVVSTLKLAKIDDIHIVTGENQAEIEKTLDEYEVDFIFNPDYANGEMLGSVQVGFKSFGASVEAVLIVLGDQPQVRPEIVKSIVERYLSAKKPIVVPSYKMHRGHPWLIEKSLWHEVLNLKPPETLRDFLSKNNTLIDYIKVITPSVLLDMDTPDDYKRYKP